MEQDYWDGEKNGGHLSEPDSVQLSKMKAANYDFYP